MSTYSLRFARRLIGFGSLLLASLASAPAAAPVYTTPYVFTTLAGVPSIGSANGTGTNAHFNGPYAVAVDSSGNLYVADNWNRLIRKVTPGGVVTTLAGSAGVYGSADGVGSAALFGNPWGVAVDASGNVYATDAGFNTIRKITPAGVVTTFAGAPGTSGSTDATGVAARFSSPAGIAIDSFGNLYVADTGNRTVRKITPAGAVTTLAGLAGSAAASVDASGSNARFISLWGVAVDSAGNVYVTDENTIRKITSSGIVTTFAGLAGTNNAGIDDGTGGAARFDGPYGIATDAAGNVYVADSANNSVRKITPAGVVTTLAGLPAGFPPVAGTTGAADGTGSGARFFFPQGLAADATGTVYVADTRNNTLRKITPTGVVTTIAGVSPFQSNGTTDATGTAARFSGPHGLTVDTTGTLYVADTVNCTIRKVTSAGVVTTFAGGAGVTGSTDGTGGAARFFYPYGTAVNSSGIIYVSDTGNQTIRKITNSGVVTTFAGSVGGTGSADGTGPIAQFNQPQGVAVDATGNVYVADTGNFTIRKITPTGTVTTLAGLAGLPGSTDGTPNIARFMDPEGIAVDGLGNVYVADAGSYAIRKVTPAGVVTTFAGLVGSPGSIDGVAGTARFNGPEGVAIDSAGNLYVADNINYVVREIQPAGFPIATTGNYTLRKITPAGVVTTLAGWERDSTDGSGSDARFDIPYGVAVDASGRVYLTCSSTDSNTIRRGEAVGAPVITAQPQSLTVTPGASAQFSVTAAASPAPTYQWFKNGTALSGSTNSTLSLTNVQSADAGNYTVTVTNSMGSVTSNAAVLTVSGGGSTPPGGGTVSSGGGAISYGLLAVLAGLSLLRFRRRSHAGARS